MRRSDAERRIEVVELGSWKEFYDLVARDFGSAPAYVFRGHANAEWKVESSLDRWERLHAKKHGGVGVPRHVHLRAFRQATRAISPVEMPKDDEAAAWAIAQHHGLRTPLLDWSLSPFVALFFAFEDEFLEEDGELTAPKTRAVLALSTSAIASGDDGGRRKHGAFPRVYSPSGPVSQRLLAQSSLFLMMPEHTDLESFIREHAGELAAGGAGEGAVLKKIRMPSEGRRECLKMLNKMNINRLTLFPDLDGAARYINDLWDIDFDSILGQFEDATYAAEQS